LHGFYVSACYCVRYAAQRVLCFKLVMLPGRFDAFRPTKKYEQASIHMEKAAVLFNLGALQSQIALQTERSSDAGVKEAAKLFQVR